MWRFILFVGVFSAVCAILWSSWRLDRRLFVGVSVGLVLFAAVFGFGAWQGSQQALVPVPQAEVRFELHGFRPLETGTRLSGILHNGGAEPVAVVTLTVRQQQCNESQECEEIAQTKMVLRRHVNEHATADINEIIRLRSPALPPSLHYRWQVDVTQVQGYRQPKGASGL